MELIRPRLTDYFGIHKNQAELDFAIQFFDEDIPLYVDPFLLWKSPSLQDQSLHSAITNSFNHLGYLLRTNKENEAISLLTTISECPEVGLGVSKTRQGMKFGKKQAREILALFNNIPEYRQGGFTHFEVIQLYVSGISKDRVSDIACNFIKSFLIDYTIEQCELHVIPMEEVNIDSVYNYQKTHWI